MDAKSTRWIAVALMSTLLAVPLVGAKDKPYAIGVWYGARDDGIDFHLTIRDNGSTCFVEQSSCHVVFSTGDDFTVKLDNECLMVKKQHANKAEGEWVKGECSADNSDKSHFELIRVTLNPTP